MKKKVGITIAAALAGLCFIGGAYALETEVAGATALPTVTLEDSGDAFLLSEQSYAMGESFVYTATAHFESGQAAALVFGASETETRSEYWAFNIDRNENSVKLLYFYKNEGESLTAVELLKDWYIGNDKMTEGEKSLVNPKVATIDKVQLKVVISVENDVVYGEFYADNIRRFGVDNEYKLNELEKLPEGVQYAGGSIGYNCFNAKVRFEETHFAESDYTYYTEVYRQQYHYSQYAHWNNDPNGLVYYNGYYHLYYQHHPFSNYWSDMYWGHARSKDLAHWELLPICLFPDTEGEWGPGNGYMWSGSAMVYRSGMSEAIDALNWFPNGNGEGLIAFYTRDGGLQDQVLMSSDDEGLTWTKRVRIPQTLVYSAGKTDCRDPKVFPVEKDGNGKVTLWGMALTGMATGDIWFLKSTNLIDWSAAGGFKGFTVDVNRDFRSECPDVVFLTADDGASHAVLTLTGRNYLVGNVAYDEASGEIKFFDLNGNDISTMSAEEIPYQKMDFGPDSYATQTFYIDDSNSEYYGKTVSVSWFSGVPGGAASIESGALSAIRKTWNGGGVTIPVEWGLVKNGDGYLLSQNPIVKDSAAFEKTGIVDVTGMKVDANSGNILQNVASRTIEISAKIENPNEENVFFRVQSSGNEYTEIGWTKTDGYYVDRTHAYDGGLSMPNYHVRYTSGAGAGTDLQFYILADNGSVEVFCDGGTVPFYVLTFAAPYSFGASFHTTGEVTVEELSVNKIASVWHDENVQTDETMLYLSQESLELSKNLTSEKEITVYATSGGEVNWEIETGEDVVTVTPTTHGAVIKALKAGSATVIVSCGNAQKTVSVTVYDGEMDSDVVFNSDGIISGDWLMTANGIVGNQPSGDGFILSQTACTDFTYTAKFDLGDGAAAALIFRADAEMRDYYIANYDKNGKIVKLWTPYGELANVYAGDVDVKNITLSVTAKGNRITVALNGRTLVDVTDTRENAPLSGVVGLNVCATRAVFSAVGLQDDGYVYNLGDLVIKSAVEQGVVAIYNNTLGKAAISREFYTVKGREICISESYFATLAEIGVYELLVVGKSLSYTVQVNVTALPKITLQDLTLQEGANAVFFIGNEEITSVFVRGELLSKDLYTIKNGVLTIDQSAFTLGENTVALTETLTATVTVEPLREYKPSQKDSGGCASSLGVCAALPLGMALALALRRKKDGNDD
ncbi:MAG: GH32 C-terminal domain-containing protein [Clostridia bacterium]|nr:GH32 C-terminal domain-containing protein [Clostridia bacterium]